MGLMEYVDARLPVRGVRVRVMVYGNEEAGAACRALAVELERAAEVPAKGFCFLEEGRIRVAAASVVNRKPVLRPMTELRGL